ncbi:MAG: dicarboxylate/amino acid:cation symporter [Saprospiraceae bacterium]|nr:dicarboxylate/amino acid:cation symporter [Saprospiraceae bacterium]
MKHKIAVWIFLGLIAGIVTGAFINLFQDSYQIATYVSIAKYGSIIFLKFIKLIIGPLVLSTLVVGVAGIGDAGTIGRMSIKTIGWFLFASIISLTLGLIIVNVFKPGLDFQHTIPEAVIQNLPKTDQFTLEHFLDQLIPENIFVALSSHKMVLQIVVFSVLFGLATAAIGDKGKPIIAAMDSLAHVMLKLTTMIMWLAPLAVFSAVSIVIAEKGIGVMVQYGKLILLFYFALAILWSILICFGYFFIKNRVWSLIKHIEEPIMLAFATASSESAYPKLLTQLERFGLNDKITSFVLPLGYSFNLDGSMMYMTFGSLLIAQAYGVDLTLTQQITMLLVLMVTSKGIAAVPRASLVVIAATIAGFGIPEAGLAILLPIDQFLDMGRTATNVVGNAVATVAVSKMEGEEIKHHR